MAEGKRAVPKGTAFRKATKRAHQDDKSAKATGKEEGLVKKVKTTPTAEKSVKGSQSKAAQEAQSIKPMKAAVSGKETKPTKHKEAANSTQPDRGKTMSKETKLAKETPAKKAIPRNVSKAATEPAEKPIPTAMRIVAGSYERLLYGLLAFPSRKDGKLNVRIEPQFVFPAHVSSIRTVACAGPDSKWLVTGGSDETIKVWDMRRRIEVGALVGHEGSIMSLSFPSRTFMLSASEDSTINLYRARDWSLLRTLRGHTGRVNCAAAHPSGRIALSVGADKMIRMWDLMRGVGAASVKIGVEADQIRWNSKGDLFAVFAMRQVMVFATDMSKVAEIEQSRRVHDVTFFKEFILVACDDAAVHIYNMDDLIEQGEEESPTPTEIGRLVGHNNRCVNTNQRAQRRRCPCGSRHQYRSTCCHGVVRWYYPGVRPRRNYSWCKDCYCASRVQHEALASHVPQRCGVSRNWRG